MLSLAGDNSSRLYIDGIDAYVPFSKILEYYSKESWLAGLAIFPPSPHYVNKELTKFFEYMAAGIPIIASNFPVWKNLIEGNECGICVDPLNPQEIANAIQYLIEHPDMTRQMGEKGRKAVLEKYNWETESKKLLQLYEQLCEK
jgi:glycosyltransferase involved in cell wall biosynthesis